MGTNNNRDDARMLHDARSIFVDLLSHDSGTIWDHLTSEWKADRAVAAAALEHGRIGADELPEQLKQDKPFLLQVIRENPKVWETLPEGPFRSDVDFARVIESYGCPDLAKKVLNRLPNLRDDEEVWTTILIRSEPYIDADDRGDLIRRLGSVRLRSNRHFMKKVILPERGVGVPLWCVDGGRLERDQEFLERILSDDPRELINLPFGSQELFPDLILKYWERYVSSGIVLDHDELEENLADSVLGNERFRRVWFLSGGHFVPHVHYDLKNDREIFMTIAESATNDKAVTSFRCIDEDLLKDRNFMLNAISKNPNLLWLVDTDSDDVTGQSKMEFALAALGSKIASFPSKGFRGRSAALHAYLHFTFEKDIKEELEAHRNFVSTLLCGISLQPDSSLALLNQDEATTLGLKRLIANFIGVPTGKRLRSLRLAKGNLPLFRYGCSARP